MEFQGLPETSCACHRTRFGLTELSWERFAPYIYGLIAYLLLVVTRWIFPGVLEPLALSVSKLFDGALAFSSIMAGFASTLLGILFSIRDTKKIRILESTGHFSFLKGYVRAAITSNITLSLSCIAGNILHQHVCGTAMEHIAMLVVGLFVVAILTVTRVTRLMSKLL